MTNKTFTPGEKVAVYEDAERVVCRIQETYAGDPELVKVNAGSDHTWQYKDVHVNQVRKFRKDTTKEIWIWDPKGLALIHAFMNGSSVDAHVSNNAVMESTMWVKYIRASK